MDTNAEAVAPPPGWRYRVGIAVLVLGAVVAPLCAPLVALTDLPTAAKATTTGLLLAGIPEISMVLATVLLGKQGFAYVKGRVMAALKRHAPAREVGPVRYHVGLVMLLLPGVYAWILMYVPEHVPGYPEHRLAIGLTLDTLFFLSFFVLGGDFWDKLRSLFVHRAKAQFPA